MGDRADQQKHMKAAETRQRILDVAMKLFLKEGFERATMRKIAQLANLSLGATYYYFRTKQHIIFHYYEQSHEDQLQASHEVLLRETSLETRIAGVIKAHIDVAQPFHELSKELFKIASDPEHALSPFSKESKPLRDKNIASFEEVIDGARENVPAALRPKLPELLWLYKIGIILYWVHDTSANQAKTYRLIDKSASIVVKLVKAYKVPMLRRFMDEMIGLVAEFKPHVSEVLEEERVF